MCVNASGLPGFVLSLGQINECSNLYFTVIEIRVITAYLRPFSLAQLEAFLLSHCGEKQESMEKAIQSGDHKLSHMPVPGIKPRVHS